MRNLDRNTKDNWRAFIKLCANVRDEKELVSLFDLFLTKAEQEDIALRYNIVAELLSGGKTQREIAKEFNVSIAKVTRGSNALRIADKKIKKIIDNIS